MEAKKKKWECIGHNFQNSLSGVLLHSQRKKEETTLGYGTKKCMPQIKDSKGRFVFTFTKEERGNRLMEIYGFYREGTAKGDLLSH